MCMVHMATVQLVLVTLHMGFIISVEQDTYDFLITIFSLMTMTTTFQSISLVEK
jgi:hypothetical protein